MTSLINELAAVSLDSVLVPDDNHLIQSHAIHDALAFVLEHQTRGMHLALATRADLRLPLTRLRGRGQLCELPKTDLRFSDEEAAGFLDRLMGLDLSAGAVAALGARTEGSIVGLQLAALSLQGRADAQAFIADSTGGHHYVLEYLVAKVVHRQPEPVLSAAWLRLAHCPPNWGRVLQRYFRAVLADGQPLVAGARVEHAGTFNMGADGEAWKPLQSTQYVGTQHPGFVWDARIRMAPAMTAYVRDAYVAGQGILVAKLFGLLTVMEQSRTPELAQGELMRFFAEAAWYPTALLPSDSVRWEAIDDTQARATLIDGTTNVELVFRFDAQGLIRSVYSDGRYREVGGTQTATAWEGRFWDYAPRDGMLIPLQGEVAWLLEEGAKPYWRGRIERIEYEYAP